MQESRQVFPDVIANEDKAMRANHAAKTARPKVQPTAEDRARHAAIRETFPDWHSFPKC
jgi:hypothetical protein